MLKIFVVIFAVISILFGAFIFYQSALENFVPTDSIAIQICIEIVFIGIATICWAFDFRDNNPKFLIAQKLNKEGKIGWKSYTNFEKFIYVASISGAILLTTVCNLKGVNVLLPLIPILVVQYFVFNRKSQKKINDELNKLKR